MRIAALLSLTFLVSQGSLGAQAPVEPGQRVRVTHHLSGESVTNLATGETRVVMKRRRDTGSLIEFTADSVVLGDDPDARLALPLTSVTKLEVSRGRKSLGAGKGALWGSLIGVATGAALGAVAYSEPNDFVHNRGDAALLGAVVLGVPGLVVGTIAGAISKTDRWEEVPLDHLRVSVGPQRDGRFGLGLSARF